MLFSIGTWYRFFYRHHIYDIFHSSSDSISADKNAYVKIPQERNLVNILNSSNSTGLKRIPSTCKWVWNERILAYICILSIQGESEWPVNATGYIFYIAKTTPTTQVTQTISTNAINRTLTELADVNTHAASNLWRLLNAGKSMVINHSQWK